MLYVIGSTGYVGKRLVEKSNAKSIQVRLDEDLSGVDLSFLNPDDVVCFCAAVSEPTVCSRDFDYASKVNVVSTSYLIRKFIDIGCKVIFLSSDATTSDRGVYGRMKREVDELFCSENNFKSLRLSYVMSKHDRYIKYLTSCATNNTIAEVFHPLCRNVIHREDVVDIVISLSQSWDICNNTIINCGGPETVSRVDIAEVLKRKVFPDLQYTVVKPSDDFYKDRCDSISVESPDLEIILKRKPSSLEQLIEMEF